MENLNIKIYLTLKIYMLKLSKNNFNSIKNLQLIIIIKDGFGCNFHGFV
jgi:hypothetical protein